MNEQELIQEFYRKFAELKTGKYDKAIDKALKKR